MTQLSKLWQKTDSATHTEWVETFTVGHDRELDLHLAPFDVLGTLAHISMLASVGLLEPAEHTELVAALRAIYQQTLSGDFTIEEGVEDVHSQVELLLTRQLGDTGKKVHAARSRNDQVLVDLKLYLRHQLWQTTGLLRQLFGQLCELSEKHRDVLLPGYTHLQVAMPSSFGLWFGAYAESLADDLLSVQAAFRLSNRNPLGSAAGYGSSFPISRTTTTRLLGFEGLHYNVVHAQMGRGKTELAVTQALATVACTLNRLATDCCLYMSQNFGFISFPDSLTTGSSIMPHKKNPDVFELIRARCNQLAALPAQVSMLVHNLPSGYHRDFQQLKEVVIPAFTTLNECLNAMHNMLAHIRVNQSILTDEKYLYLFSVEEVNRLVLQGMPFRDAYRTIGQQIEAGTFQPSVQVQHTHEGSIGNLCLAEIRTWFEQQWAAFGYQQIEQCTRLLLEAKPEILRNPPQ